MINVTLIPILRDNYAYFLQAENGESLLVDPGQARPIINYLEVHNIKPDFILITHHHFDHMDGATDILNWNPCPIIGADPDGSAPNSPAKTRVRVPFDRILDEESDFQFGGERVKVLATPGHTPEHLCYYFENSSILLSGDTLFSLGCGRILDGTPEQLWNSLQKLAELPDETLIYCGHEYTQNNGAFCLRIEPENEALKERVSEVEVLRSQGKATLPTSLKKEKETNIFLRSGSLERFAHLRALKDKG